MQPSFILLFGAFKESKCEQILSKVETLITNKEKSKKLFIAVALKPRRA